MEFEKRGAKLTGSNLEHHMRVRINANDDMNKFPAAKYAAQWINENHFHR